MTKLAQAYLANGTAIAPVLRALFLSPEFAASVGQKIRTPYEDALATMPHPRAHARSRFRRRAERPAIACSGRPGTFGQAPMGWPAPNGYPDVAAAWGGASSTLNRWNFHLGLAGNWTLKAMTRPDWPRSSRRRCRPTYAALVDALAAKLLITLTTAQRDAICRFLDHAPTDALKAGRSRGDLAPAVRRRAAARLPELRDPLRTTMTTRHAH